MLIKTSRTRCNPARSGLAPLELVLALPLLLSVMALIVNFAHASIWKTRSATSSRLAMWRHRPMWNADGDPKPPNFWPAAASLGVDGGNRISAVDQIWNQPAIIQPWIKGPVFVVGSGYLGVRDNRVNEMSEGVSRGRADVQLPYPFLPSMGRINMSASHTLLDSAWQYHTMGYAYNDWRRAKGWWQLEDSPDWAGLKQVFLAADSRMTSNPQRELLRPLDRDDELYRRRIYGWDFYPKVGGCYYDNDPQLVLQSLQQPGGFLDRIPGTNSPPTRGVCQQMATAYLNMYQDELAYLQGRQNPPAARIAQLKQWIQELSDFLAMLP